MPTIYSAKHEKCGDGPVIYEHDGVSTRIVCCACWEKTPRFIVEEGAREKWRKMQAETLQKSTT